MLDPGVKTRRRISFASLEDDGEKRECNRRVEFRSFIGSTHSRFLGATTSFQRRGAAAERTPSAKTTPCASE
jgi:hypothetical protein